MFSTYPSLLLTLFVVCAISQQRGSYVPEIHPPLTTYKCTKSGGCVAQTSKVVLDAGWRWLHGVNSVSPCQNNGAWDPTFCPDPVSCARNCAYDGANYTEYGITTSGSQLSLTMYPKNGGPGSLLYLLSDDNHYQLFKLKNQEITFDVDVSSLPCGTNGALYLLGMAVDGGQSAFSNNKAGAYLGTGYCDAQCPNYLQFINGEANLKKTYGSCCTEMDIWEANSISTDLTAHPCSKAGTYRCNTTSSTDCKVCDGVGCDFNPYRMGNTTYYGPGSKTVTTDPGKMRVITQFITTDGTSNGALYQIRRLYIRGGRIIYNAQSLVPGISGDMLTDNLCASENNVFSPQHQFAAKGGMATIAASLDAGMVMAFSLWVDPAGYMRTLDGNYPSSGSGPGVARGSCPNSAGKPSDIKAQYPNTQVQFSNIRYGDLDSTYGLPWP